LLVDSARAVRKAAREVGVKPKVMLVVGARPNFVKAAALHRALRAEGLSTWLCHTGQHYDWEMSGSFFRQLGLPKPKHFLGVGSGSHAAQTSRAMVELERTMLRSRPALLLLVGDVNSTMAGALAAAKIRVPVAHVEAGLRSFDRAMPEEVNRIVTDALSDHLFVTEEAGVRNLRREGANMKRVHLVGNVMVDTLMRFRPRAGRMRVSRRFGLAGGGYALATLHRPANVDRRGVLRGIVGALEDLAGQLPVVLSAHPRTTKNLKRFGLSRRFRRLRPGRAERETGLWLLPPQGYLEFMSLMIDARLLLTDSGGLQSESSALGVPCLTLRDTTEQPVTLKKGTVKLVGSEPRRVRRAAKRALRVKKKPSRIPLWDGRAAGRIAKIVKKVLG
jgi:UDP-N-acetylglucosamine 2-epimerase (non-hydrolysing)